MKFVCIVLLSSSLLLFACKKTPVIPDEHSNYSSATKRIRPPVPPRPVPMLPISICINSYEELLQILGSNKIMAKSVILANGFTMQAETDLQSITYEAVAHTQPNSLFDSRLIVEWRYPGGNWQLNISDTWSLGCVFEVAGQPPYTNLIKGADTIQINTCFYWGTNVFTGERIDYIIIE